MQEVRSRRLFRENAAGKTGSHGWTRLLARVLFAAKPIRGTEHFPNVGLLIQ
ncbi:hypothetical protein MES5069_10049 [Mesorhizobium escarrei]|uniref:Uncharacterized protein n=1 Tax=Mesorhizobium escarrei TaxID=666018 RepID=A0ABN8JCN2_9HYPH|nr:hypothetical protein MES5069_10049 [Mesorhizobium escarrei]